MSYPHLGSQFHSTAPLGSYDSLAYQGSKSQLGAKLARLVYRVIVTVLVVATLVGVLFGLYRNDLLLAGAKKAGLEARYLELERRFGSPGWGTPRSVDVPGQATVVAEARAAEPVAESAPAEAERAPAPAEPVAAAAAPAAKDEPTATTADGLPIVSLDALPTVAEKKAGAELSPVSPDSLPTAGAARASKPRAAAPPSERKLTRSIPLPSRRAPEPAPVAKAEPPKPKKAPEPSAPPATAPRRNDSPLNAAIRAAVLKGPGD